MRFQPPDRRRRNSAGEKPIRSARIAKSEQGSKSRWHLDVKVAASLEIGEELLGWLKTAYELCA